MSARARFVIALALAIGSAVAIAGAFGTWLRSGARNRSSFAVFDLVDRLGFSPDGPFAAAIRWWPMMPVVLVAANVAWWWRRSALAAALAILGGGYAVAMAIAVSLAPNAGLIRSGSGTRVTLIGAAIVFIVGSAVAIFLVMQRFRRTTAPER